MFLVPRHRIQAGGDADVEIALGFFLAVTGDAVVGDERMDRLVEPAFQSRLGGVSGGELEGTRRNQRHSGAEPPQKSVNPGLG